MQHVMELFQNEVLFSLQGHFIMFGSQKRRFKIVKNEEYLLVKQAYLPRFLFSQPL